MANNNSNTKVTYDVSDAISEITQLAKVTQQAGSQAQEAFNRIASSSQGLAGKLSGVANIVRLIGSLGPVFGPLALGLGAVGAAVAAVAASFADLPTLLRDSEEAAKAFDKAIDATAKKMANLANLKFSGQLGDIADEQNQMRDVYADITREIGRVREARSTAQRGLVQEEQNYRRLGQTARTINQQIIDDQRRLASLQDSRLVREKDLEKLLQRARTATAAGDTDRAQSLIDSARSQITDPRKQALAVEQVDAAERSLERTIAENIEKRKQQLAQVNQARTASAAEVKQKKDVVAALTEENRALQARYAQYRADAANLTNQKQSVERQKEATSAALEGQAAFRRFGDSLSRTRTELEDYQADLAKGVGQFSDGETGDRIINALGRAKGLQQQIQKQLGVNPTVNTFQDALPLIEKFQRAIGEIGEDEDLLPKGFKFEYEQLKRGSTALDDMAKSAADLQKAGQGPGAKFDPTEIKAPPIDAFNNLNSSLSSSAESSTTLNTQLSGAAESAARLQDSLSKIPSIPSAGAQTNANLNQPGSQEIVNPFVNPQASTGPANVTVTVNGGMIDTATINQITQQIQRNLRLGLS